MVTGNHNAGFLMPSFRRLSLSGHTTPKGSWCASFNQEVGLSSRHIQTPSFRAVLVDCMAIVATCAIKPALVLVLFLIKAKTPWLKSKREHLPAHWQVFSLRAGVIGP
jgi:hypothetical protein